jgi:protein-tyrosine-phosphatase
LEAARVVKVQAWSAVKSALRALVPRSVVSILGDARALPLDRRVNYVQRRLLRALGATPAVTIPPHVESVLFVCHGNIMRSAAAAGFLRDELSAKGITNVRVTSAGTHAHDGRPADARAQSAARELGLSLDGHRAARLTKRMVEDSDVIFAMDELNFANILATFPESRAKLLLFGGMTPTGTYHAHEIFDPYMTSGSEVNATIALVKRNVSSFAEALAASRECSPTTQSM